MDDLFCVNFTREEPYYRSIGEYKLDAVRIRFQDSVFMINSRERR